jgi:tetratricopeptide (TPR) repeat protein
MRRERPAPITFTQGENGTIFNFVLGEDDLQSHDPLGKDEKLARDWLIEGKFDKAVAAYQAIDTGERAGSEGYINNQGLELLDSNADLGIQLLLVNTEIYPGSANTWDSVGYAYQQTGDKEKALYYFHEALKRDADFASALAAVAELEGGE